MLTLARQLDAERQRIREATQKEDDDRHRLKLAEKDKAIEGMAKQGDELRRKIDQGSQQLQGEVLEKDIRSVLEDEFRDDVLEDVPTGRAGSDIVQKVNTAVRHARHHEETQPVVLLLAHFGNHAGIVVERVQRRDRSAGAAVVLSVVDQQLSAADLEP